MGGIELCCAAIVAIYLAVRLSRAPAPREVARRLILISAAGFVGEDTCIRAYHFYAYAPSWHLFLDQVPLAIVVIWPVVIDSALELARHLDRRRAPLWAALIVLADAALIEPIAVRAGLWSWSAPGLFAVPPVGVLGWAFFTLAAAALVERAGLATILLAPLATHALLLASWWGGLRWVSGPIASSHGALAAWLVLVPVALGLRVTRARARVPPIELWVRVPGAIFFFALLALSARSAPLAIYALAFAPPWLALLRTA